MDVMVKDKKGKYITDLKADDFTVVENGVPQKVEFFDPPLSGNSVTNQPKAADAAKPVAPSSGPTHIISLVLDGATTEQGNLKQVREGMLRYIRERIAPADMVAIFAVTTDLRLLQAFTQDKAKMIAAIDKTNDLTASNKNTERNQIAKDIQQAQMEMEGLPGTSGLPQSAEAASLGSTAARSLILANVLQQYLKLRAQLSVQQARPVLASLAAICEAGQEDAGAVFGRLHHAGNPRLAGAECSRHRQSRERRYLYHRLRRPAHEHAAVYGAGADVAARRGGGNGQYP
jgi:VWFA-related protein